MLLRLCASQREEHTLRGLNGVQRRARTIAGPVLSRPGGCGSRVEDIGSQMLCYRTKASGSFFFPTSHRTLDIQHTFLGAFQIIGLSITTTNCVAEPFVLVLKGLSLLQLTHFN